jgi:hypothetical protein
MPKGVVYHHRGAYLNALGQLISMKMDSASVYLWVGCRRLLEPRSLSNSLFPAFLWPPPPPLALPSSSYTRSAYPCFTAMAGAFLGQ